MRFDQLDRQIALHDRATTVDTYGQRTTAFNAVAYATLWAGVEFSGKKKRETVVAQGIFAESEIEFTIRHPRSSITISQDDQIVFDGDRFGIVGIEEIGRRDGLRLFAKRLRDES